MIDYSAKRKHLQSIGEVPMWYTTAGQQLFDEKYAWQGETVKSRFSAVAKALAQHAPKTYPEWWSLDPYTVGKNWEQVFFDTMWDGFVSPSTPLLANGGLRKRGTTVSCAGGYMPNSLAARYNIITEAAVLTKHSHGTSYAIGDWPHEGAPLARGGRSNGILPVIRDLVQCMDEVVQGSRRGSLAYSLPVTHGDFHAVLAHLYEAPESNNVGWLLDDAFEARINAGDSDAWTRLSKVLAVKMPRGKGYLTFTDKMNRHLAQAFKDAKMSAKASNLCQEVNLGADEDHTFSCVILNLNLELWKSWPKYLAFIAHVMSDCNITEYLATIREMSPEDQEVLQKIYRFTDKFRAIGNGVLGFHTLLQRERIVVGSLDSFLLNDEIFSGMQAGANEANRWLGRVLGCPTGCAHLGLRNATTMMMPPTKSTAELMAGASEGIGLDTAMAFIKQSAGGEFFRINKVLLEIMKERGVYNDAEVSKIARERTVKNCDWLTDHEKQVFRTAFEIPMDAYLDLCAQRQNYIDQGQSINLYFTDKDSPEYIMNIVLKAIRDPNILAIYYFYSMRDSGEVTRIEECELCM